MNDWLKMDWLAIPAVLVTVATVEGSGPRETGAKMLVTADAQCDTIGGGHLEMRACEIAREMLLALLASAAVPRRLERFALGPSLGQCCGGVVHLAFEYIDDNTAGILTSLPHYLHEKQDSWRVVPMDDAFPAMLLDQAGNRLDDINSHLPHEAHEAHEPPHINIERPCHLMRDGDGRRWLIDPCRARRPHLVLFGAGHVGAAIIRTLAALPCRVTWVDEREDMFPTDLPANVMIEATDTPECVADRAPVGSSFLVLTHSHTLDLRLSEHILRRPEPGDRLEWFGLIGSRTKRRQFEHRLAERGIERHRLDRMVCPIGLPGIAGKAPAVIAVSVAAQLLQMWETAQHGLLHEGKLRIVTG